MPPAFETLGSVIATRSNGDPEALILEGGFVWSSEAFNIVDGRRLEAHKALMTPGYPTLPTAPKNRSSAKARAVIFSLNNLDAFERLEAERWEVIQEDFEDALSADRAESAIVRTAIQNLNPGAQARLAVIFSLDDRDLFERLESERWDALQEDFENALAPEHL